MFSMEALECGIGLGLGLRRGELLWEADPRNPESPHPLEVVEGCMFSPKEARLGWERLTLELKLAARVLVVVRPVWEE